MGKALKDGRMLDLPLALPLCALIVDLSQGEPGRGAMSLTLRDVALVDKALGRSLDSVAALASEIERAKVCTSYTRNSYSGFKLILKMDL